MKLISFRHANRDSIGVLDSQRVIDLAPIADRFGHSIKELLERDMLASLREAVANTDLQSLPLDAIQFRPVIDAPGKILCIGINFATHVKETGREMPKYPMIFTRFADSLTAHGASILRPQVSSKLDFEGELAVVIGRPARHVKREHAFGYVAGYSAFNDGSVRDWQKHTLQFTPGKNFPHTGAFGPWLVTADEFGDPSLRHMTTRLNGEVMQDTGLADMIFDVPALIEYCSAFTPLAAGDVIVTGTTGGVGAFREPPVWMKPGDVVEVEISGIGVLRNGIADEARVSQS